MRWSIVIPTWQRAESLRRLLQELEQQALTDFDVIVVCDGPDPETGALAKSHDSGLSITWRFHPENQGLAAARNTGANATGGEYLLFLDDDVSPSNDLLEQHEREHQIARPAWRTVVLGRIVEDRRIPYRSYTDQFIQRAWERDLAAALPQESLELLSVGAEAETSAWFGLNCSISRKLFLEAGGFDPVMRSDEETEFGLRLYRRGVLARYCSRAVVRHLGSKDMSAYYPRCWRLSGALDLYRATQKGERSAQIAQMGSLAEGAAPFAWRAPTLTLGLARIFERLTNATGNRDAFGAWARLRHAGEYWKGTRDAGATAESLQRLRPPELRVLMLHSLSAPQEASEAEYYISPQRIRRFLHWLRRRDYVHVDAGEVLAGKYGDKSVLVTLDDAYDDLYCELPALISEFQIKPVVFVVAGQIGKTNAWDEERGSRRRRLLTSAQMQELQRQGVTFGSHTISHPLLTRLNDDELRREVQDSKRHLEDQLGSAVEWFAYPYGDVDRRVRAAVLEAGYRAAVTTNEGSNRWQDRLTLNRIDVSNRDWWIDFAMKVSGRRDYRKAILRRIKPSRPNA